MVKQCTFKGIEVHFEYRKKAGKTTVVLLHGFLESRKVWEQYTKELAKQYEVVAIDLLGHGDTGCTGYVHSMEEMAEVVDVVLKSLHIRRAVLIGHSMGGYAALAFAEKFPDKMKGLCLFNSSAFADSSLKREERDRAIKVVKKHHDRFIKEAIPNLFVSTSTPVLKGALKRLLNIALATPKQGIIAALEGMKIRENRELIVKFAPCPVFYVMGKKDRLLPYEKLIEQCELHEGSSYFVSEKGGHLCFYEDTYPCLTALKKFIGSC